MAYLLHQTQVQPLVICSDEQLSWAQKVIESYLAPPPVSGPNQARLKASLRRESLKKKRLEAKTLLESLL